jgi:hypothetical protein
MRQMPFFWMMVSRAGRVCDENNLVNSEGSLGCIRVPIREVKAEILAKSKFGRIRL